MSETAPITAEDVEKGGWDFVMHARRGLGRYTYLYRSHAFPDLFAERSRVQRNGNEQRTLRAGNIDVRWADWAKAAEVLNEVGARRAKAPAA